MEETVEILLAAYNGEHYLREQIESLLRQTWTHWHLTVSDDGSTDNTPAILDEYAARYPQRIRRARHDGRFGGACAHFFWLMETCEARYMMFCDQDDVWHPDKVEKTMRALLREEAERGADTPVLVFTNLTPVDEALRPIGQTLMQMQKQNPRALRVEQLLFQNVATGCTLAVNRALARLAGGGRAAGEAVMHDWWLALVAARFGRMVYVDESTLDYRQHGANSVGAQDVGSVGYVLRILARMRSLKARVRGKKRQALAFRDAYAGRLRQDELALLSEFGAPRSPWRFKRAYLKWIQTPLRKVGFWLIW